MHSPPLYGAIEAGGTKFVCAVAREPQHLLATTRIATTTPGVTLDAALAFFVEQEQVHGQFAGIGIASFGPLDLHRTSATYGHLVASPKPLWSHTDLVSHFEKGLHCPVAIDTDVNAAALAEALHGSGYGCSPVVYITVGTGIGGGVCIDNHTLKGALHPEMGHIRVARHPLDSGFRGVCPFHGDCLEGLASGVAVQARYGRSLAELPPAPHQEALQLLGYYLGQMACNVILLLSPEKVIFGGGLLQQPGLLEQIRSSTAQLLDGYVGLGESPEALEDLIVAPGLGTHSGIAGALLLAAHSCKAS
jgi:fructokinase